MTKTVLGRLILIFITVPLVDLILLITVSQYTGWPISIGVVILSGIVGAVLARRASASVSLKIQERFRKGEFDPGLLSDGAMIFFAAGLLLTPGFITDLIGFSILIAPIRAIYKRWAMAWLKKNFKVSVMTGGTGPFEVPNDPNTVDGSVVGRPEFDADVEPPVHLEQKSETN